MNVQMPTSVSGDSSLRHLWLELTSRCNLECVHCYADSGPYSVDLRPLTLSQYQSVLWDARSRGCASVQFIGGEPTISPHLIPLCTLAREIGFEEIEVFSNLTRMNSSLWEIIKTLNIKLATSLYGHTPQIHDNITTHTGSFQKTVAAIKKAVQIGIPIRVGVIEMNENKDAIPFVTEFLDQLGVTDHRVDHARPIGRLGSKSPGETVQGLCGNCWKGTACIGASGEVSPCIMSKGWTLGSIHSSALTQIWNSDAASHKRAKMENMFYDVEQVGHLGALEAAPPPCPPRQPCEPHTRCGPSDHCNPNACHPQVGGPEECHPRTRCMPELYPR